MAKRKSFKKKPPHPPADLSSERVAETSKPLPPGTETAIAAEPPKTASPISAPDKTDFVRLVSRRDFLSTSGAAVAGLCGAAAVVGLVRGAQSNTANRADLPLKVGRVSNFKVNTMTFLKDVDLFIVRDDTGVGALSAKCTHLGCTVRRTADGFACPCHGAIFDPTGKPVFGPARRALPWYTVQADKDGALLVYLSKEASQGGPAPLALPASEVL